ncbi:hypothetical protein E8E13_002865 [Curvularia kusanoi]|uniref:Uncharacterized protein n=1 Tax=Curvularia kusanoi TaxID=90978 RepID=A0A9P4T9N8_CURKU|nr:hypothetical protein E8E13_002865 [Curvularia kusanoi]
MTEEEAYLDVGPNRSPHPSSLRLATRRAVECGSISSFAHLITKYWPNVEIPEEIVKDAASSPEYGKQLIALLLENRATKVAITEATMEVAAENKNGGREILLLLRNRLRQDLPVTASAVKAAVGNLSYGTEVIMSVLDQPEVDAVIDAGVLEAAAGNERYCSELIVLLLTQQPDLYPSAKAIEVAVGRETIKQKAISLLLSRKRPDLSISEHTLARAVKNREFDSGMMSLLIRQQGAENSITGELADLIAGKHDEHVVSALLDLRGVDVLITERFLKAAAENDKHHKEVMLLLTRRLGIGAQVTFEQTRTIMGHFSKEAVASFLDKQGAEVLVTKAIVEAAIV